MGHAIEELAHFIAGTPWEAIPKSVREHAKLVVLDTVGVILAGSIQPEVAAVRARLTATGGHGATIYAAGAPTADPRTAAFLNGLAGRSIELCEGHRYVSCQGAVQALPTALVCAEWLQRSGREALAGLIFGYEVAARVGAGLTARPLAHQNGQAPLLGAVGAGARVRGLNGDQTSLALRLGAVLILTPGYTNAVSGATALNVAGGMSGFAGILAPELALAGVAAQPNAIEEAFGQLVGDGFRPEAVTEELGRRWEITRNYFRLRACCNPIYSALDASVPRLKPARVTLTLTDGRQVTRLRESARGDFQDPYREDEVRAKFRELAGVVLSPGAVTRVEELVERLDELEHLSDLVVALTDRALAPPREEG